MIIQTDEFRKVCSTILSGVDGSELSALTETLELKTVRNVLHLAVTNKEYYLNISMPLDHEENFQASVNANLFLKLIAAITTESIEITIHDTYINVKANGNYKLPLIFEDDHLMSVPEIVINNPTVNMTIPSSILESIVNYNTKQLAIGSAAKPVQKMFYLDQEGCITFTSGACVNSFTLPVAVKTLLNQRLVNLFKLFKGAAVDFTLGYDAISETIIQTKVSFKTPSITLTAITGCDDNLLNQVPAKSIRDRATKAYDNTIVVSVAALSEAVNRLLLFASGYGSKEILKPYGTFEFVTDQVTIYDTKKENTEILKYENGTAFTKAYSMQIDLIELKKILDGCTEQYLTILFGDGRACVVVRGAIRNVIPEAHS